LPGDASSASASACSRFLGCVRGGRGPDHARRGTLGAGGRGSADRAQRAFFSTIATFGTAVDITLAEVAVEAFYPADARTAMRLLGDIGALPAGSGA
jgi:hypothetical protein